MPALLEGGTHTHGGGRKETEEWFPAEKEIQTSNRCKKNVTQIGYLKLQRCKRLTVLSNFLKNAFVNLWILKLEIPPATTKKRKMPCAATIDPVCHIVKSEHPACHSHKRACLDLTNPEEIFPQALKIHASGWCMWHCVSGEEKNVPHEWTFRMVKSVVVPLLRRRALKIFTYSTIPYIQKAN